SFSLQIFIFIFSSMLSPPPTSTLFPYTTLFRSKRHFVSKTIENFSVYLKQVNLLLIASSLFTIGKNLGKNIFASDFLWGKKLEMRSREIALKGISDRGFTN